MTYGSAGSVQSEMNPMATEWTQETVLRFLTERGGRVRNGDLIDNFRAAIPTDPKSKTAAKEAFKRCVDNVAFVKVENGEKYVCLKKKFRGWDENSNGHVQDTGSIVHPQRCVVGDGSGPDGVVLVKLREEDHEKTVLTQYCPGMTETDEDGDAKQKMLPAVDCGTDRAGDAQPPAIIWESVSVETAEARVSRTEMGNRSTCISEGMEHESGGKTLQTGGSAALEMSVPEMVVTECPVAVETDGAEMIPPQPACSPTSGSRFVCELKPSEEENPARRGSQCFRRRSSRGSQRGDPSDGGADEGRLDPAVTSGGDGSTPKGSRENFIKHMMISSPQVRRSMVLRNSVHLPAKCKDPLSECDFCGAEDESAAVTLDPLEHEWMMCASDGEWENLHRLLTSDPNLITKKDFVTGFTCLHWAAKLGRPELVAVLVNFAKKHGVMVNINVRSSAGYTPLHLAAMHNHMEVVKLLVGAYDADVEARDYSGKKASHYLRSDVAQNICDIVGAGADPDAVDAVGGDTGRWRLSKVLPSNLRPLKLLNHGEDEVNDGAGPLRRKTSLKKLKPRLSKIVHSTSLFERLEKEADEASGLVKSRPKSNLFG